MNVKLNDDRVIEHMDIIELDTEIRELKQAIIELNAEPTSKGALNYAKSDLSYLIKQLSI